MDLSLNFFQPIFRAVISHAAQINREITIFRCDIMRRAALDNPDVQGREWWIINRRRGRRGFGLGLNVLLPDPFDKTRRTHHGRNPLMQSGRMHLFATHMKLQIITALMTGHNLHLGRLAYNHSIGLGVVFQQTPRHIRRAKQPDLLIP